MKYQELLIPDGYTIIESKTEYDVDDAVAILSGRGCLRVTEARRLEENRATLATHRLVCPHCRTSIPAYARFLQSYFEILEPIPAKVPPKTVAAWGGIQRSLWNDSEETLVLNPVYRPRDSYICPHCSQMSKPARGSVPVIITNTSKCVTLSCFTTDIGELFRLPWKAKATTSLAFPFRESVTFNFKTGRVYISLQDNQMHPLAIRNINGPDDWKNSKVYRLLSENTMVKRKVRRCFQSHWTAQIPFAMKDLTPDTFVKLATYIDYPSFFYSRIPATGSNYRAEKSFRSMSDLMHTARNFQIAVRNDESQWPKSIRKLLYTFPDYGFYLPEIKLLSKLIPNPDYLRAFLGRSFTYSLFSFLHQHEYSHIAPFFNDYIKVKGTKHLLSKLEQKPDEVLFYSLTYSSLTPTAQLLERKKWQTDQHVRCFPKERYSLPMRCNMWIPDTKIGAFHFVQLKSKSDYLDAAKQLKNCLKNWEANDNPVFIIRRNNQILGAIEVENNDIVQARGYRNLELPEECEPAYAEWKDRYHLTERDPYQEIDVDDIPYRMHYFPMMFF